MAESDKTIRGKRKTIRIFFILSPVQRGADADLGASLSDIVWSLRRGGNTLQSLGEHLVERASRLFPGGGPELQLRLPETWPQTPMSLSVRRNIVLIVAEALHNAARHSHARRVILAMACLGRTWAVTVADVTSPYVYDPADTASHSYQVRSKNASCTSGWSGTRRPMVLRLGCSTRLGSSLVPSRMKV